jgi:DNA-binding response OmpR family regulator
MEKQIYRALVVDDDQAVREATARAMSAESFWCDTACDGQEALK